jgi:hypothetical protein
MNCNVVGTENFLIALVYSGMIFVGQCQLPSVLFGWDLWDSKFTIHLAVLGCWERDGRVISTPVNGFSTHPLIQLRLCQSKQSRFHNLGATLCFLKRCKFVIEVGEMGYIYIHS